MNVVHQFCRKHRRQRHFFPHWWLFQPLSYSSWCWIFQRLWDLDKEVFHLCRRFYRYTVPLAYILSNETRMIREWYAYDTHMIRVWYAYYTCINTNTRFIRVRVSNEHTYIHTNTYIQTLFHHASLSNTCWFSWGAWFRILFTIK